MSANDMDRASVEGCLVTSKPAFGHDRAGGDNDERLAEQFMDDAAVEHQL